MYQKQDIVWFNNEPYCRYDLTHRTETRLVTVQIFPKRQTEASSVQRRSVSMATIHKNRLRQRQSQVKNVRQDNRKNTGMLDKKGKDKLTEETGSTQTKYTREVGIIHTGEAHQHGAGKQTRAGRGSERRGGLDTKKKQETEPERMRDKQKWYQCNKSYRTYWEYKNPNRPQASLTVLQSLKRSFQHISAITYADPNTSMSANQYISQTLITSCCRVLFFNNLLNAGLFAC